MRHLGRNIAIVLIVLFFMGMSIFPPEKNLRLGKDLAGGVSLVYTVDVPPNENPDIIIPQVIRVLSERINPDGLFEISFVRQGRDRLVVTMPLPSQQVQDLRKAYEDALEKLRAYDFDTSRFERAMRMNGQARTDELNAMIGGGAGLDAMLGPVRDAAIEFEQADRAFREVDARLAEEPELADEREALLEAASLADEELGKQRKRAISLRVSPEDVREAFTRSDEGATLQDGQGTVTIPSPRERALTTLREKIEQLGGEDDFQAAIDAYQLYRDNRTGLDDPDELELLLSGSGVLEFRIAATPSEVSSFEQELRDRLRERGPSSINRPGYAWVPLNKVLDWVDGDAQQLRNLQADPAAFFRGRNMVVEERPEDGLFYMLVSDRTGQRLTQQEGEWALRDSYRGMDNFGRPAINFRMDARGAKKLGEMTGANVGKLMAIVLDDRVYTAANLRERISSSGQISGSFSERELAYIIQTLNAGSLSASLSDDPISRSILAPELGLDNLKKGLEASVIALILVGAFMICYYFTSGVVAGIALACNALIILGAMSLNRAAFTLPGIAGIVLTFGMAVDANVLIYERIREELNLGEDPKTAVRIAYQKVLSTIVDANVTNLIVCIVLAYTASQEIKGFAITLGIGVVATMFSALLITRVIFSLFIDKMKIAPLAQLPTAVPFIDRLFTPRIDWIRLRPLFVVISVVFMAVGVYFMSVRQEKMLDTEFVGGTQLDLRLKETDGQQLMLTRADVQERVDGIVDQADQRVASGSAAPERITSIDWTVRDASGEMVSRRQNVASNEQLRTAQNYADVVAWLDTQGAFGDADPGDFTVRGGDGAASTPVANGEATLTNADGYTLALNVRRVSPDVLLGELRNAEIVAVNPQSDGVTSDRFQLKSSIDDAELLQSAIVAAFAGEVDSQPPLSFSGSGFEDFRSAPVFPITSSKLGDNIGKPQVSNDIEQFLGGVVTVLENISPAPDARTLHDRLEYVRRQAVYASDALARPLEVIVLEGSDEAVTKAAIVVSDEGYDIRVDPARWEEFAQQEWEIVRTSLAEAQTLAGVESFSPEIAATFRNQAIVAIVLSFVLITMYIWARFGSVRYSVAALSCLVHDVVIAIGLIALAEILYDHFPGAAAIGIQPFKIDLGLIAAILTIIGYSLNDTIIILDRIRENRGKLAYASKEVINNSINETISRTVITSMTTLLALIVMFLIGGEGIASFTYAMICGVIVGTYSSIAVAAPLVYTSKIPTAAKTFHDRYGSRESGGDEGSPSA